MTNTRGIPSLEVVCDEWHQIDQEQSPDSDHMVGEVYVRIREVDYDPQAKRVVAVTKEHKPTKCTVKQSVGDVFEPGSIEVSRPVGYSGPYNHENFAKGVQHFIALACRCIPGRPVALGKSVHEAWTMMKDNTVLRPTTIYFPVKRSAHTDG